MQLLIHLGLHKTGTTTLQRSIFDRTDLGFLAEPGGQSRVATNVFVTSDPLMFRPRRARDAFASLLDEASRRELVPVISQEALSSIPEKGRYHFPFVVDRLVETFGTFRVLLTIREQRALLIAIYRQGVRSGAPYGFSEALGDGSEAAGWAPPIRAEYLFYDKMLEYLEGRLGRDRVCVLPLEWLKTDREAYLRTLFQFSGVKPVVPADIELPTENRGWSPFTTEVARHLYGIGRPRASSPSRSAAHKAKHRFLGVVDRVAPTFASQAIERSWAQTVRERTRGLYGDSNRRLEEKLDLPLERWGYEMR